MERAKRVVRRKPDENFVVLVKRTEVLTNKGVANKITGPKAKISIKKTIGNEVSEEGKQLMLVASGNVVSEAKFKKDDIISIQKKNSFETQSFADEIQIDIKLWGTKKESFHVVIVKDIEDIYYLIVFNRSEEGIISSKTSVVCKLDKAIRKEITVKVKEEIKTLDYLEILRTNCLFNDGIEYTEVDKKTPFGEMINFNQLFIDTNSKFVEIYLQKKEELASLLNTGIVAQFDATFSENVILHVENNYLCIQAPFHRFEKDVSIFIEKHNGERKLLFDPISIESFKQKEIKKVGEQGIRKLFDLFVYNAGLIESQQLFKLFAGKTDIFRRNIMFYLFGFGYQVAISEYFQPDNLLPIASSNVEQDDDSDCELELTETELNPQKLTLTINEPDILGNEIGYYVGEQLQFELSLPDSIKINLDQPKRLSQRKTFSFSKVESLYSNLTTIVEVYKKHTYLNNNHKTLFLSITKNITSLTGMLKDLKNMPPRIICFVGQCMQGKSHVINDITLSENEGVSKKEFLYSEGHKSGAYSVTKDPIIVTFNSNPEDDTVYIKTYYSSGVGLERFQQVEHKHEPFNKASAVVVKKVTKGNLQNKLDMVREYFKRISTDISTNKKKSPNNLLFYEVCGPFTYLRKHNINIIDTCGSDDTDKTALAKSIEISKSSNFFVMVFKFTSTRTIPGRTALNSIEQYFMNRIHIPYLCLCRSKLMDDSGGISSLQVEKEFYDSISTPNNMSKNSDKTENKICYFYNIDKNTIYYLNEESQLINDGAENSKEYAIENELQDIYLQMLFSKEEYDEAAGQSLTDKLKKNLEGKIFKESFVAEFSALFKSFPRLFYEDIIIVFLQFWKDDLSINEEDMKQIRKLCDDFFKKNDFDHDRKQIIKKITPSIHNIPDTFQLYQPFHTKKGTAIEHQEVQKSEILCTNQNFNNFTLGSIFVNKDSSKSISMNYRDTTNIIDITLYEGWETDLHELVQVNQTDLKEDYLFPLFIPSKGRCNISMMDSLLLNNLVDHLKHNGNTYRHIIYIVVEEEEKQVYQEAIRLYINSKRIQRNYVVVSIPGQNRGIAFARSMIKVLYMHMVSRIPKFEHFWTLDDDLKTARFFSAYSSYDSGMEPVIIGLCLQQCQRMFFEFSKEYENRITGTQSTFVQELLPIFNNFLIAALNVDNSISNRCNHSSILPIIDHNTDEVEFCKELKLITEVDPNSEKMNALLQAAKQLLIKTADLKKKIMKLGWLSFGYGSRIAFNYNRHEPIGTHFRYSTQMSKCTLHHGPATMKYNYLSPEQLFLPQSDINDLIKNYSGKKKSERALKSIIANKQYKFDGESTYYSNLLRSDGIHGIVTHYFDILTVNRGEGGNQFLKNKKKNTGNIPSLNTVIDSLILDPKEAPKFLLPIQSDENEDSTLIPKHNQPLEILESEIDGKNNCMFYSLLLTTPDSYLQEVALLNTFQEKALVLRECVSKYLLENKQEFIDYVESEEELERTALEILNPQTMGDEITIHALANLLSLTIVVHIEGYQPVTHGDGEFVVHLKYYPTRLHYDGALVLEE